MLRAPEHRGGIRNGHPMSSFQLHPQLAADTVVVRDLPLSLLLLMEDRRFPWFILVPREPDLTEIIDLDEDNRAQLWREIDIVARAVKTAFKADKLNVAALGNVVPQLHVHIIGRFRTDAAWPKPVWVSGPSNPTPTPKPTPSPPQSMKPSTPSASDGLGAAARLFLGLWQCQVAADAVELAQQRLEAATAAGARVQVDAPDLLHQLLQRFQLLQP